MDGHLSKRDRKWLNIAAKLAETSEARQRHGAVVVRGGSVQGMGVNKFKNDPLIIEKDHTTSCGDHAEIAALKRTSRTEGATVYVARVNFQGKAVNSKPCNNCQTALSAAGIRRVIWTT